ncbi:MAG: TerC/Alx family metal homeostasis membrane protein [Proteobacteria bacterium]|nr:TerC/Alx family metal homeostasis membrane protein [Pseudomonadota bacterium]
MPPILPWFAFAAVVLVMLAFDLGVFQRDKREPSTGVALAWTGAWVGLAALFGLFVTATRGADQGVAFATAYVVEQALSVDNLFVMMLVFAQFGVPRAHQRRVLTWGIVGVIVLRGAMILSGTALIGAFHALTYLLGGVLLVAAWKLAREIAAPEAPAGTGTPPGSTRIRALLARVLPITDDFVGDRFTVVRRGVRHATPLLLALVTIELADAVFALDSIPAVFGVTTDRFLAFSSNLFAVLGLRSMFFALAGLLDQLRYLKHGLVGVLGLVGTKMIVAVVWPMPTWLSLALVTLTLGGAIVASLVANHSSRTTSLEGNLDAQQS